MDTGNGDSMNLSLSDAEVSVLASALAREQAHLIKLRGHAEQWLADGEPDWLRAANIAERDLAALDSLVGKLPAWVGPYMTAMAWCHD